MAEIRKRHPAYCSWTCTNCNLKAVGTMASPVYCPICEEYNTFKGVEEISDNFEDCFGDGDWEHAIGLIGSLQEEIQSLAKMIDWDLYDSLQEN